MTGMIHDTHTLLFSGIGNTTLHGKGTLTLGMVRTGRKGILENGIIMEVVEH
jgi:hypothetical protein